MRVRDLVGEALASAKSQRVPSLSVALLALAMVLVTVLTVGRTAGAEAQVQLRLESAGSRTLTVHDSSENNNVTLAVVDAVGALSVVHTAFATSLPQDATPTGLSGALPAPVWWFRGNPADVVTLVSGRWPDPGEAIISESASAALGLEDPVGALTTTATASTELPVVGIYRASGPWSDFEAGALTPVTPGTTLQILTAIATSAGAVADMQSQILALIAPADPQDLRIDSPTSLAEIQTQVGADLNQFSRSLLYLILGAGAVLTAIVVLADVLVRQKDLGRRRALGATRSDLVAMVLLRTLTPATTGALIGVAGAAALSLSSQATAPLTFAPAVAVLAILTTAVAAVPPALLGAYRDPILVLRTP